MATLNGNTVYLSIDGVDVSGFWTSFTLSPTVESVDVTAGSATAHRERAAGLADTSCSGTIVYDAASVSTYIQKVKPGEHTIIWGPEGNTSGKPKHEQVFIITDAPHTVVVEKEMVAFEFSGEAAAAPVSDMYAGVTF